MQAQQPSSQDTKPVHAPKVQQQPKATWHRPTLTFVPLHTTALKTGSFFDGADSTTKLG